MNPAPIGLQMYTLRDDIEQRGLQAVLKDIADIGYKGVEPFNGIDIVEAASIARELGLEVPSVHYLPPPVGDGQEVITASVKSAGAQTLIVPYFDPEEYYQSAEGLQQVIDVLNASYDATKAADLVLAYHNHDFEFNIIDGQPAFDTLLEQLNPNITIELDVYWTKVAGHDPIEVIKRLGERAPLLHIKDGPATGHDAPQTALGEGVLDIPAIVNASVGTAEWLIVELDQCATDMMTAVQKSYAYLVGQGLATGTVEI